MLFGFFVMAAGYLWWNWN